MEPASQALIHFRWDLDKTYLHTEFDTLRDLVRTFRQSAEQKRSVAGAPTLLRALLRPGPDDEGRRVTFISGSPRQMRRVLAEKLRLDGIEPDAFVLKPNLSNLLKLRFRALNDQLGYKLAALLGSCVDEPVVDEVLFGDDSESDALIYSLYGDIVARRIDIATLEHALSCSRMYRSDIERIVELARAAPLTTNVRRIFIHLDRRSPTARFDDFGARVVPVYNYFQAAVVLFGMGTLSEDDLLDVTASMEESGYSARRLANSLQDIIRRGYVESAWFEGLQRVLCGGGTKRVGASRRLFIAELRDAAARIDWTGVEREWVGSIDYAARCGDTSRYRRERIPLSAVGILGMGRD